VICAKNFRFKVSAFSMRKVANEAIDADVLGLEHPIFPRAARRGARKFVESIRHSKPRDHEHTLKSP
jgi:hypothetical protein